MKISKCVLSVIMSLMIVALPQIYAFASEEANQTANDVVLLCDDVSVDNASIAPGSLFKLSFNLKNLSKTQNVKNVSVKLNGGEAFSIQNDVDTIFKESIAKNTTVQLSKSFYCNTTALSGMYPINISASYTYSVEGEEYQGSTELSYTVKVTRAETSTNKVVSTPVLTASFNTGSKKITPGDTFKLNFTLSNTNSELDVNSVNIRLSGGEAFNIVSDTDALYKESITKNSYANFSKTLECSKSTQAGMHPVTVSVSYEYLDNGEKQQGSCEFTFSIKTSNAHTTRSSVKLTPQLIVSGFSYGGNDITGGDNFTLSFSVKNNSESVKIQNVVVKLVGGESFVVADGTDTLYLKSIEANKSVTLSKSFRCLPSAMSGVYPISASVSYEYIEDSQKQTANSELTMSVPVVQPDRVTIQSVELSEKTITVNEENDCGFSIINSGQTKLANGRVRLIDENSKELASAFIGNIEPGSQYTSNYNLPVTFEEIGTKKLTLVFEYENENTEKKTVEYNFNLTVEEYFDPYEDVVDDNEIPEESLTSLSKGKIIAIGAGGAVGIAVVILIVKKAVKKKKVKKGSEILDEEI